MTSVHPWSDTRIFNKMCRSLAADGGQVILLAPIDKRTCIDGINIFPVRRPAFRIMRMLISSYQIFKYARQIQADIYHFHDPELLFVGRALRFTGRNVVYDVHEDYSNSIMSNDSIPDALRTFASALTWAIERNSIPKLNGTVSATPGIANKLAPYSVNSAIVNNYPVIGKMVLAKRKRLKSYSSSTHNLIYAGSISLARGIVEMVEALVIVNKSIQCTLLLCGKYSPQELETRVRKLDGYEFVKYFGQINREELSKRYRQSQMGIVLFHPEPNHIESQPNKLYEYMEAGLPILASNFTQWQRFISSNRIGVTVNPLDPLQIANKIIHSLQDPEKLHEMGKNGNIMIQNRYNWENEKQKLGQFYKNLLN